MLVDYERVVLELKKLVAQKSHHGQRDLLAEVARLEAKHQLDEGLPEKALRLYGVIFTDDLLRPFAQDGRVLPAAGPTEDRALRDDSSHESLEDNHAGTDDPRSTRSSGGLLAAELAVVRAG